MKKIFWMFVAAMAWTGCSDDNGAEAPVPSDTLELSAETLAFDADGGVLELMSRSDVKESAMPRTHLGLTHLAFDCGSREQVDALTERLRADGYPVLGEPRMTGDGYYESVVGDPDGNLVELVYKQKS